MQQKSCAYGIVRLFAKVILTAFGVLLSHYRSFSKQGIDKNLNNYCCLYFFHIHPCDIVNSSGHKKKKQFANIL